MELLTRFGLADKAADYPDRLSGGQQQRVAIVRALAMQPKIMLFDEITSALDPELVGEVLNVIRDLKDAGLTMMLATHEMAFAREIATRVAFLDGGEVAELGPPEQVLSEPRQERTRRFLRPRDGGATTMSASDGRFGLRACSVARSAWCCSSASRRSCSACC